jgi:hypothetical protein
MVQDDPGRRLAGDCGVEMRPRYPLAAQGGFLERLFELDAALAQRGWPAFSDFWRATLRRCFGSRAARYVWRVGRRGGKSTSLAKLAVAFALYGAWSVPPGELATIAFLSVDRREANARLRTIRAMLDALGEPYAAREGEIELQRRPVVFRVLTASVQGVVGLTCILVICDEVSRWRDAETNVNPAKEIVASVMPTMATQPSARLILSSSPWSENDFHAQCFDAGDTGFQAVAHGATWEANPTLTEEATRRLEPHFATWQREYAAIPSAASTAICSAAEYDFCVASGLTERPPVEGGVYSHLVDPGFRRDAFVVLTVHRELGPHGPDGVDDLVALDKLTVLQPTPQRKVTIRDGIAAIIEHARAYPGPAYSDQHYFDALAPGCQSFGVDLRQLPDLPSAMTVRVANLQSRFSAGTLRLLDSDVMRKQTLTAQLQLRAHGQMVLRAPDRAGFHDDVVSCLLKSVDPAVIGRLPYLDAEVVAIQAPITFSPGEGIGGGEVRYFDRQPNGQLVPRDPPYGSEMFLQWMEEMQAQGLSTPSIERWKREGAARPEPLGMNVPVEHEGEAPRGGFTWPQRRALGDDRKGWTFGG